MTMDVRIFSVLRDLDEQGILHASATTLGRMAGCTPQHARRVLDMMVDEGAIRMRLIHHQPDHPMERFRYKTLYCLNKNYEHQMELGI